MDGKRHVCDKVHRKKFLNAFADSCPEGDLPLTVGRNLSANLTERWTRLICFFLDRFATFVDLLAHKTPDPKILEIGVGTRAATEPTLRSLASYNYYDGDGGHIPRFSQYVYTVISPAFFENAKARFQNYSNRRNLLYWILRMILSVKA